MMVTAPSPSHSITSVWYGNACRVQTSHWTACENSGAYRPSSHPLVAPPKPADSPQNAIVTRIQTAEKSLSDGSPVARKKCRPRAAGSLPLESEADSMADAVVGVESGDESMAAGLLVAG